MEKSLRSRPTTGQEGRRSLSLIPNIQYQLIQANIAFY